MNARAHIPEALVPLEQMLIGRDTTAQGRELLAALTGADLPWWVVDVLACWNLYDTEDAAKKIVARLTTGCRLFNAEIYKRKVALRIWLPQERAAYSLLYLNGKVRTRLLTTQEADLIAAPVPTVAPYLRSCVRGGWRPGLLACTLLDLLNLNTTEETR